MDFNWRVTEFECEGPFSNLKKTYDLEISVYTNPIVKIFFKVIFEINYVQKTDFEKKFGFFEKNSFCCSFFEIKYSPS